MSYIADESLAEMYEKETGKKADYEKQAESAIGAVDYYYYDDYVEWLEERLLRYQSKEKSIKKVKVKKNIIKNRLESI